MKKTLALVLALVTVAGFSACGKEKDADDDLHAYKQEEIVKTEEKIGTDTFKFESIDSETVTITGFSGASTPHTVTIPKELNGKTVAAIKTEAFANCSQINKVDFSLATGLETIEEFAFRGCEMITELTLPASVKTVKKGAFYGCFGLTKITFSASVTEIAEETFMECTALTEISIPGNIKTVGRAAFFGCTSLTAVTLADGVETIGDNAFQQCTALVNVTIPASVTAIGNYAFAGTPYSKQ